MNRPQMGLVAWVGVIIVIGLIITYPKGTSQVTSTAFSGIGDIIRDLQLRNPSSTSAH